VLLEALTGQDVDEADLLSAVELAGDYTVVNDQLVQALLALVHEPDASEELRAQAAISLGPVLEHTDIEMIGSGDELLPPDTGIGTDELSEMLISEEVFHQIAESLRQIYKDPDAPDFVRRHVLEAAVRAPQDWHQEAVREAYASDDPAWRLTAVFSMRWIEGFDAQILDSLKSQDAATKYHAICAAGNAALQQAWPHIEAVLQSETAAKPLLLAAIEAAPNIRPEQTHKVLADLLDSNDEDIVAAVHEAMAMAELISEGAEQGVGPDMFDDEPDEDDDKLLH
jgi:hypothetical protein